MSAELTPAERSLRARAAAYRLRPGATSDHKKTGMTEHKPLWQRASTEVFALVIEPEIDALLGRAVDKERALLALAARQELAERMRRYRWLAIEAARAAGATWDEIDTTLRYRPGLARREYQTTLALQQQLGLATAHRHDPGTPEVSQP